MNKIKVFGFARARTPLYCVTLTIFVQFPTYINILLSIYQYSVSSTWFYLLCIRGNRFDKKWSFSFCVLMHAWCMICVCLMHHLCVLRACLVSSWCELDMCLMHAFFEVRDSCLLNQPECSYLLNRSVSWIWKVHTW